MLTVRTSFALAAYAALAMSCASAPPLPATASSQSWTDPLGRVTGDLVGEVSPRDAQELTFIGEVHYRVYGVNEGFFSYRVYAFAYPWAPGQPFDLAGEIEHASNRTVARLGGTPDLETDVVIDGVKGKEIRFSLITPEGERGHGIERLLIGMPPTRYEAFCIGRADVDLAPCEAFIRTFRPKTRGGS